MSNCIFPKLPGLTFDIKPVPTWSTVVQKSKNRARTAIMNDPYPLWTFEISFEFLRDSPNQRPGRDPLNTANYTELQQLVGFYNARGGSFDSFLLDPGMLTARKSDWEANGAPAGTGDGTTTTFYLQRDCGGFLDEVQATVGPIFVSVNGVVAASSAWTQNADASVTFTTAPASGAVVTWDGRWMYRVAFAEDKLDGLAQFMYELYECQKVTLEQVKL
jgi:uncharacterized protein (TIGR02217 family)